MKLKTSYFNSAVLKKDITRFAPAWGLYTVFSLLYLVLLWGDDFYSIPETMALMGTVNFFYGGLCAVLLFGDLFTARLCNALHAMPMRREGWFLTHVAAGLLFGFVPNALGAVLAAFMLEQAGFLAFLWLAVVMLEFLFFFGVGVFCVMCAGNRLGAVASYGLINLLAVLVAWLVETFYAPVLPGVVMDTSFLAKFSPVVQLTVSEYVEIDFAMNDIIVSQIIAEAWWYAAIVAVVGIGFGALGLVLYRKRNLETAGDFISFKPASPVFLVIYTLCVGAMLYLIAELFNSGTEYVFLLIGLAVGFFTGKMLLEKKVKVFQKKNFIFLGILVFAFWMTVFATWLDPFGITRYVPEAQQVKSVTLYPYEQSVSSIADSYYYRQRDGVTLTDTEDIAQILNIHEYCVENVSDQRESYIPFTISYKLKSGAKVERFYYISGAAEQAQPLKQFFSATDYILDTEDVDDFVSRVIRVEYNAHNEPYYQIFIQGQYSSTGVLTKEDNAIYYNCEGSLRKSDEAKSLFAAIKADCEEGNLAQLWDFHSSGSVEGSISIEYRAKSGEIRYLDITVYGDSINTTHCLNSLRFK